MLNIILVFFLCLNMSSIKIAAIFLCLQMLWALGYGNIHESKTNDKEFKGHYEVFKVEKENYLFKQVNGIASSEQQATLVKILVIGGTKEGEDFPWLEIYYPDTPELNHVTNVSLLIPRHAHTSFVLNNQTIVTTGGINGTVGGYPLSDCEIFNPVTSEVKSCAKMNEPRAEAASAVLNGEAYVCGGNSGYPMLITLQSCERFSYQSGSGIWEKITQMPTARFGLAMATLQDYVYAIAGYDKNDRDTVERYDRSTDTWSTLSPIDQAREAPAAAVVQGSLYLCGGLTGATGADVSCYKYDDDNDKWNGINKMHQKRYAFNMIAAGNRLFAVAGDRDDGSTSVEQYDSQGWTLLKKQLIHERRGCTALLLP